MVNYIKARLKDLTIGTEFWELVNGKYNSHVVRKRLDVIELKKRIKNIRYPKEETPTEYEAYRNWLKNGVKRFYLKQ